MLEDRLAQWIADEEVQGVDYVVIDLDSDGNLVMHKRCKLLTPLASAENNATQITKYEIVAVEPKSLVHLSELKLDTKGIV